jgi:ABC-2 type transport system ATP-binding protein
VGVMLQRGGIYPMLSPRRVLSLFAAYYPDPKSPAELLSLLSLVGVADVPWRHLSGGEQQRLSLALALVGRPEAVFLDEPTAGVDPEGRLSIRAVIKDLAADGVCVLLTTHELGEAERLADQVLIIDRGRAVAAGTPEELTGELDRSPSVRFSTAPSIDVTGLGNHIGAAVSDLGSGEYQIGRATSPELTAALAAWLAERDLVLRDLRTAKSLEEIYLELVSPDEAAAAPAVRRRGKR